MIIREMEAADRAVVLELNNAAVPAVNPHTAESFDALCAMADTCWVVEGPPSDAGAATAASSMGGLAASSIGGLLITFGPGSAYPSKNYVYLSERYDDFRYVDRIIIAPTHKRQGLGSKLYSTLAERARSVGAARLLCEVNVEPPNPQSLAFHADAGWIAIEDRQHAPGAIVRYLQKLL